MLLGVYGSAMLLNVTVLYNSTQKAVVVLNSCLPRRKKTKCSCFYKKAFYYTKCTQLCYGKTVEGSSVTLLSALIASTNGQPLGRMAGKRQPFGVRKNIEWYESTITESEVSESEQLTNDGAKGRQGLAVSTQKSVWPQTNLQSPLFRP